MGICSDVLPPYSVKLLYFCHLEIPNIRLRINGIAESVGSATSAVYGSMATRFLKELNRIGSLLSISTRTRS